MVNKGLHKDYVGFTTNTTTKIHFYMYLPWLANVVTKKNGIIMILKLFLAFVLQGCIKKLVETLNSDFIELI